MVDVLSMKDTVGRDKASAPKFVSLYLMSVVNSAIKSQLPCLSQ